MKAIKMRPIGEVKNNYNNCLEKKRENGLLAEIIIKPEFSGCLNGLEEYSHIVVLFWMHKINFKKIVFMDGLLATRDPVRPNPIGLTIVELLAIKKNVLTVNGLDAFDGSPVIDIKPYTGHPKDLVLNFRSPDHFEFPLTK